MENYRWEGNKTNIRFITFEIQNRIEESLPLSRVMMPKVPISSFQWRRNLVEIVCNVEFWGVVKNLEAISLEQNKLNFTTC
jgi:hypothetical protein